MGESSETSPSLGRQSVPGSFRETYLLQTLLLLDSTQQENATFNTGKHIDCQWQECPSKNCGKGCGSAGCCVHRLLLIIMRSDRDEHQLTSSLQCADRHFLTKMEAASCFVLLPVRDLAVCNRLVQHLHQASPTTPRSVKCYLHRDVFL